MTDWQRDPLPRRAQPGPQPHAPARPGMRVHRRPPQTPPPGAPAGAPHPADAPAPAPVVAADAGLPPLPIAGSRGFAAAPALVEPSPLAAPARSATRARTAPRASGPTHVTPDGTDWLASACRFPDSVRALWQHRPGEPRALPCGTVFDVVSAPALLGRRLLDRLWSAGPGSGPVAVHGTRVLLFAAPGTAHRLPALLDWDEWNHRGGSRDAAPADADPGSGSGSSSGSGSDLGSGGGSGLLCHGPGDHVTLPAPQPAGPPDSLSRWLVAPDVRHPWLPGPGVLLRACLRARAGAPGSGAGRGGSVPGQSIFETAERGVRVYDVNRRR